MLVINIFQQNYTEKLEQTTTKPQKFLSAEGLQSNGDN